MVAGAVHVVFHVVGHAGVEDLLHARFHQVHDVAVDQFGRVAQGVRGNGGHAFVVNHGGGFPRDYHFVAQFAEEDGPEGEVLVHVQHPGDADAAPGGSRPRFLGGGFGAALGCGFLVLGSRRGVGLLRCGVPGSGGLDHVGVMEEPLVFIFVNVRRFVGVFRFAFPPFAAVAGKVAAPVGEGLHGHQAVVAAAIAAVGFGGDGEFFQLFPGQQGGMTDGRCVCRRAIVFGCRGFFRQFLLGLFQRKDGGAVSPHEASDVRTDDVLVQQLFHVPQHGVVVERAALHHDMVAQFVGIF